MLPLAWAAAAGGGTGWVPAVALLATFGAASTYTLFLAALSEAAGGSPAPALSTLWRLARLPGARCVDGGVAVLCGGCCAFAADLFHALAARAGFAASRAAVLAALLVAPLSPLCLGDDLSVLKYSSYAGLAGVAYTLVVAFLCHYNALQYYQELEPAERSPRTYAKSAGAGALATAVVFGCTLFGGVAAFGGAALPNVLNNFGDTGGAALARLGTGVAILSGFPLMFAGLKVAPAAPPGSRARAAPRRTSRSSPPSAPRPRKRPRTTSASSSSSSARRSASPRSPSGPRRARSAAPAHKAAGGAVAAAGSLLAVGGSLLTYKTHAKH
ncbi:hypothetical protein JL720_12601 [Aureococcus anophagefferens]|nr:hypothetical protein JL720_12601 [Aureococcus anophagefferens]